MTYSHPSLAAVHAAVSGQRAAHVFASPLLPPDGDAPSLPPEWVMLVPAGSFSGRDGRGPYTLDANAVLSAFAKGGIDLPIDYDHQTLDAEAKAGPVPAAGWIKELQARDGALWGRVGWTPRAADLIAAREYRFLSPVFRHDKQGRILALEGAGLTHYPNLDLEPVAHTKGDDMTDLTPIAVALGVEAANADVAALAAHAARLKEAAARQPDPAQWVPMSQHKAVADELARLQAEVARQKAEAAVTAAMRAGKLAPALKDWATDYASRDPQGFAAWAEKAPVVLPPEGESAAHRVAQNADTLTEEDRIACQLLGMREADFAAHKRTLIKE
ncbi:MAG: phage protease [Thiobacillaceae bacterium]